MEWAKCLAVIGYHALFTLHHLQQYRTGSVITGVSVQDVLPRGVWVRKYGRFYQPRFEPLVNRLLWHSSLKLGFLAAETFSGLAMMAKSGQNL